MTTVSYQAKRSIVPGNVSGTTYSLDMMVGTNDRVAKTIKKMHESVGGNIEVLRYRQTIEYKLVTIRIKESDLPMWYEYFDSTDGGESHTFDRYGTSATPNNPEQVKRIGDYRERRHNTTQSYRFDFRLRKL